LTAFDWKCSNFDTLEFDACSVRNVKVHSFAVVCCCILCPNVVLALAGATVSPSERQRAKAKFNPKHPASITSPTHTAKMSSKEPQPNDAEKNIEIWKVKKLIKRLEAARGNGTSMISLIIRT
jgi:hypothetical protein